MEGWLSLSIFLAAAIFMLSLMVCLPDIISSIIGWLQLERPSNGIGTAPYTQRASVLLVLCKTLVTISGGYLAVALYIKSNTR